VGSTFRHSVIPSFVLLAALGCDRRPRAPALEDGSVYANAREGFRFLVPEGWSQQAKADLPPGPLERERVLVIYHCFATDPPASLEVSAADLPESADLAGRLTEAPSGGITWRAAGPAVPLEVNGVPARRYPLRGLDLAREVTVFRRGGRVYFFAGTFIAGDLVRRGQVRQAADSVLWK
jgi:hypothetical protein